MPSWPLTNRMSPDADQYSENRQKNKISFEPEVGPSIDRRRGTAAGTKVQINFTAITNAERIIFEEWYRDELYDGVLAFDWLNPVDDTLQNFKFIGDSYTLRGRAGREFFDLSFTLLRFP